MGVGGVLGPSEDAADVNEDWEPACELTEELMELTRGDPVPVEYACCGGGGGKEGSLSLTYSGR